jgi:transglutaminase-like putative cysteine protease
MTATLVPPPVRVPAPAPGAGDPQGRVAGAGVTSPALASGFAVLVSTLALAPLFSASDWFGATLLTVVVVVTVGTLATAARLPVFLVPIAMAVALLSTLVARFTTDAPFGLVPTPDSLAALRVVLAQGMADINRYAPPAPYSEGIAAIAALGVGCVALTVFVLQVNLRMPTAAGLPLIALYVVPSVVLNDGSPWWAFTAVIVAWLVLLVTDERVGLVRWGKLLRRSDHVGGTKALSGASSAAFRLGATAIVAAIVLPILVPGLADAVLGRHPGGTGGDGSGQGGDPAQIDLSPIVSLRKSLLHQPSTPAFTYRTDVPASKQPYLRAVALETFDGESWKPRAFEPATAVSALPTDGGVPTTVSTRPVHIDFATAGLASTYLPVSEYPTSIRGLGDGWFVDLGTTTVFSPDATTTGASWSVDSVAIDPSIEQLRAAPPISDAGRLAGLVAGVPLPSNLSQILDSVPGLSTATTPYDQAVVLQDWFRDTFTYSTTDVTTETSDALSAFLTSRRGYCEQFAATMALMARKLGIASRVVVGYTPGAAQADGSYVVTGKNAHAWPELFFEGIGWVRFEPTPSTPGAPGIAIPGYAPSTPPTQSSPGSQSPTPSSSTACLTKRDCENLEPQPTVVPVVDLVGSGPTAADTWRLRILGALAVLALVAAAVPAVWRWMRRQRRLSADAGVEDAWSELRDTARDLGLPWSDASTPRQAVAAVVVGQRLTGDAAAAATRIGRTTERSRYAPVAPSDGSVARDVATVRSALMSRAEVRTRLRALLLPTSLRRPVG